MDNFRSHMHPSNPLCTLPWASKYFYKNCMCGVPWWPRGVVTAAVTQVTAVTRSLSLARELTHALGAAKKNPNNSIRRLSMSKYMLLGFHLVNCKPLNLEPPTALAGFQYLRCPPGFFLSIPGLAFSFSPPYLALWFPLVFLPPVFLSSSQYQLGKQ